MRSRTATVAVALGVLAAVVGAAGVAPAKGSHTLKFVRFLYDESNDGSIPERTLEAYIRGAESVTFTTKVEGRKVTAGGRYDDHVTAPHINSGSASHPWVPDRHHHGQKVMKAVKDAIHSQGLATIRVRAERDGDAAAYLLTINVADCFMDPPSYPLNCEVDP